MAQILKIRRAQVAQLAKGGRGPQISTAGSQRKRVMDVERALRWAFCEELPKTPRAGPPMGFQLGWGGVTRALDELSLAAPENRFGLVPDLLAERGPDEDALRLFEAVQSLDDWGLSLPDDWAPLEDLPEAGALGQAAINRALERISFVTAQGERRLKLRPSQLLRRHAILGGCPDYEFDDRPKKRPVMANGKVKWFRREVIICDGAFGPSSFEIETEGYDARRARPYADAYRKDELWPDPLETVISRAEYEIWLASLHALVGELDGRLARISVQPSQRPARPWMGV